MDVNQLFKTSRLPDEFTVVASVKPDSQEGGYLIAITDDLEQTVVFGLQLLPSRSDDKSMYVRVHAYADGDQRKYEFKVGVCRSC